MKEDLIEKNLTNYDKFKFILESINEIVWEVNLTTYKLQIISEMKSISGYSNSEIHSLMDYVNKVIIPEDKEAVKYELNKFLKKGSLLLTIQFRIRTKYREIKWVLVSGRVVNTDSKGKIMIGTATDITERKSAEDKMIFMAYHDQLTGLPNKAYFINEMKKLAEKSLDNVKKSAVILIDIDNLNSVNDSFGGSYGDVLLKLISEFIKIYVKDYGIVARMYGDEFIILVTDIKDEKCLRNRIKLISDSFRNPFEVLDIQTYVTVSMGISIFECKNLDIDQILKNTDIALYEAKMKGKNNFIFYNDKLEYAVGRKKIIENNLQKALVNNEFKIYYQPQIDIDCNKIRGFEALLRWESAELGSVLPSEFIPIAEESGLIYKIGEWVLKEACMQAKKWKEKCYPFDTISVNISPKQIKNKYFFNLIQSVLKNSGIDPRYIEIEITEGTLIKSIEEKSKILEMLINQGIKVSIDDFGKGYSSLNYLVTLPLNTLKIDKSFIDKICKDRKVQYIVKCIIELSKKLGYNVIAEGVESLEQKDLLKKIGCTYVQGYYYSKPLPACMIEDIFNDKEINYA